MLSVPPASTALARPSMISCAARMIAFRPEPHAWLTVKAGTVSGRPARNVIWRATFGPPPACRAQPQIESVIRSAGTLARRRLSVATATPRSAAVHDASVPPNLPIGVLTAPARKTFFMLTKNVAQGRSLSHGRPRKETSRMKDLTLEFACRQIAELFSAHAEWLFVPSEGGAQSLRRDELEIAIAHGKLVFSCWTETGNRCWHVLA